VLNRTILSGLAFIGQTVLMRRTVATSTGAEVQRPLATVVIGGLFSSTVLTFSIAGDLCATHAANAEECLGNVDDRKNWFF
jgi:Cu/Ag efflux pump CusA